MKYQAAHHELVASAMATKLAHEIDPENKIGCMLAAGQYYPYSCDPKDVFEAMKMNRDNYFFIDVQSRGEYQVRRNSLREGYDIGITAEDEKVLRGTRWTHLLLLLFLPGGQRPASELYCGDGPEIFSPA